MYPREIETSVHMRLYTLSKRQFVFLVASFFIFYGITLCIGLLGPPIVHVSTYNETSTVDDHKSIVFNLHSPPFSIFHQQLWLTTKVNLAPSSAINAKLTILFQLGVTIKEVSTSLGEKTDVVEKSYNRTRSLECSEKSCEEIIVAHIGFLDAAVYHFNVFFQSLDKNSWDVVKIKNAIFNFKTYNPTFTQFEIWFRFTHLVISFIVTCSFSHSLRPFRIRDWSIEQKWVSVLLPLLLLYNNPLLPLNFLIKGWIPSLLDAIFQITFMCALLLFWLCIYHGVRQNERPWKTFYLPKMIVVGLLWMASVILSAWQNFHNAKDPTYYYRLDANSFLVFKIFFFTCGSMYVLYLLYLLVRAFAELRNMPYFSLRLKFLTILTFGVILLSFVFTALRFGINILDDNFIPEIATNYDNSLEFCGIYGLLNLYLITMAYVYSPSKNARMESHFKDNPTISMLNDSDEDVVYGSDYEETALMSETRKN